MIEVSKSAALGNITRGPHDWKPKMPYRETMRTDKRRHSGAHHTTPPRMRTHQDMLRCACAAPAGYNLGTEPKEVEASEESELGIDTKRLGMNHGS